MIAGPGARAVLRQCQPIARTSLPLAPELFHFPRMVDKRRIINNAACLLRRPLSWGISVPPLQFCFALDFFPVFSPQRFWRWRETSASRCEYQTSRAAFSRILAYVRGSSRPLHGRVLAMPITRAHLPVSKHDAYSQPFHIHSKGA